MTHEDWITGATALVLGTAGVVVIVVVAVPVALVSVVLDVVVRKRPERVVWLWND